jgi:hypothetical protein
METNRFTNYCIKGLEKMYIPSEHVFAFASRLIDGRMVHIRDRVGEYRFTMNALMGLHRAQSLGSEVFLDIESDYHRLAARIDEQNGSTIEIAATAWTGRSIGTEIPSEAAALFHDRLENAPQLKPLGPKALAWLIIACLTGGDEYHKNALSLAKLASERYIHARSALVRQTLTGLRKSWASYGVHSYMAYAFLLLARRTGDAWAGDMGLRMVRKLVQLQGRAGQWGWMYHVPSGRVADYYPVYSVHQYAYAPLFLVEAIDQGHQEFREPLVRGFRWILGQNELGQSMVDPAHQIVWRRMVRKGEDGKLVKVLRAAGIISGVMKAGTLGADAVRIDHQCWGFEMALPLCVFSGRDDFGEILNDNSFA